MCSLREAMLQTKNRMVELFRKNGARAGAVP